MSSMMTLKDAATFTGRSASTVRSWIRKGLLNAGRDSEKGNSPLVFTKEALVEAMQKLGILESSGDHTNDHTIQPDITHQIKPKRLRESKREQTHPDDNRERLISALEAERDRLIGELREEKERTRRLEARIESEQERGRHQQDRIAALEREVASLGGSGRGVWGYIGSKIREFTEK